ncbi:MAG: CapA family protein [Clostridia bacterium]|nr:CapA family protein [Clostridia bacterium]
MKKLTMYLYIALAVLLTVMCSIIVIRCVNLKKASNSVPSPTIPETKAEQTIEDSTITVSISAAGDCTFGHDINSIGGWNFDTEFDNNNKDFTYFLKNVKPYFKKDDLTIVNFEGVLSDRGVRADKEYAFRGSPDYINILTSSSVEAANLSNNHVRDYGEAAFEDTQSIMSENNIIWFYGKNYAITDIKGIKVGLIGTNNMNYEETSGFLNALEELKTHEPNLIIASFHWGEESAKEPTQRQIELAHSAIDNGADLVLGHHPHVLQGIEKYNGKYIVYSLGNFCFGGNRNPVDKDTMIFNQTFSFKDEELLSDENVSVIPCSVSSVNTRNNFQPTPLSGDEFERVKEKILERSSSFAGIENVKFVKSK